MREQPLGPDLCLLTSKPTTRSCYSTLTPHWEAVDEDDIHTQCAPATERYTHRVLHTVAVSYPEVDWEGPRQTAGWTALQWQALTWTTFEVTGTDAPLVAFSISGAPEFALVSTAQDPLPSSCIEWYRGDYYGYDAVRASETNSLHSRAAASVPHLITVKPGRYYLMVKALYEIRVLGDPHGVPRVKFTVDLEVQRETPDVDLVLITSGHRFLYPDIVNGRVAGSGADNCALVGVAVRNSSPRAYKLTGVGVKSPATKAEYVGLGEVDAYATVKVTLRIWLDEHIQPALTEVTASLCFTPIVGHPSACCCVDLTIPLKHIAFFEDPEVDCSYKVTYLGPSGVEMAIIAPPLEPFHEHREVCADTGLTIVLLHGAGVDVEGVSMRRALRRQKRSFVVLPTGITPWGLDWQQASSHSWRNLLFEQEWYRPLTNTRPSDRYFLMGHSNGGQGAWYGLTHMSDRFVGGIVAAGYMSLQEYVPFTWTEGRHSTDPILRAILDAALNDYRNDMHASNLIGMPLLVKYGAQDDNVPQWHSRAMVSLIDDWNAESRVNEEKWPRIVEVPHRGHWWDEIFQEDDVQAAIDAAQADTVSARVPPSKLTVTCADPSEMHSVCGWKIVEVDVPGRVARLEVEYVDAGEDRHSATLHLRTTNIRRFEVDQSNIPTRFLDQRVLYVDQDPVTLGLQLASEGTLTFYKEQGWALVDDEALPALPCPRQISSITSLLTLPRFLVILPATSLVEGNDREREKAYASVARRWAADLLLHISADVRIVTDEDFLRERDNASRAAAAARRSQQQAPSAPPSPPHHQNQNSDAGHAFPLGSASMGFSGLDYYDDPHMIAMRTDDDYAEYHGGGDCAYNYSYGYGYGQSYGYRLGLLNSLAQERKRTEEAEELCERLRTEASAEEERQRKEQEDVESRSWIFFGGPKENKAVGRRTEAEKETGGRGVTEACGRDSSSPLTEDSPDMRLSDSRSSLTEENPDMDSREIDFIRHLSQEQWKIGERTFAEPGLGEWKSFTVAATGKTMTD